MDIYTKYITVVSLAICIWFFGIVLYSKLNGLKFVPTNRENLFVKVFGSSSPQIMRAFWLAVLWIIVITVEYQQQLILVVEYITEAIKG